MQKVAVAVARDKRIEDISREEGARGLMRPSYRTCCQLGQRITVEKFFRFRYQRHTASTQTRTAAWTCTRLVE